MTFFAKWVGGSESPNFLAWNRNKRSIALNLKSRKVHAIIMEMAKTADVVVQNFRPGVLAKLGYGYEDFKAVNPRIIYCSGSGYGEEGPYVDRPGQDMLIQGLAGLISNTGRGDQAPVPAGAGLADQIGAMNMVYGILSALYYREKTGKGQKIEVNLLAGMLAHLNQEYVARAQSRRGFRAAEFRHRPSRHAGAVRHLRDERRRLCLDRHEPVQDALRGAGCAASCRLRRPEDPVRQARRGVREGQRRDAEVHHGRTCSRGCSPPTSGAPRSRTSAARRKTRRSGIWA